MDLTQYTEKFLHEQISGEILMELDDEILKTELGVTSKLHRLVSLFYPGSLRDGKESMITVCMGCVVSIVKCKSAQTTCGIFLYDNAHTQKVSGNITTFSLTAISLLPSSFLVTNTYEVGMVYTPHRMQFDHTNSQSDNVTLYMALINRV